MSTSEQRSSLRNLAPIDGSPTDKSLSKENNGTKKGPEKLLGPDLASWSIRHLQQMNALLPTHEQGDGAEALALFFRTNIFSVPSERAKVSGIARRGVRLPVERRVYGKGCKGNWYQVKGNGYICTTRGFIVGKKPEMTLPYSLPDLSKLLPYLYAKVIHNKSERMYRIPTHKEDKQIARVKTGEGRLPDVVEKQMNGIYFLAIDREEKSGQRTFYRTVRGRFVRKEDIEFRSVPPMYGEWLGDGREGPLAFIYDQDRPVYRFKQNTLKQVGIAEKHARFWPQRMVKHQGRTLLQTKEGLFVDRAHVRVATQVRRPPNISSTEKWIHLDLSQQTLVAYEGDRSVFATIVSGGKQGYEAPAGLFRIHKKYISSTMKGADPSAGWYEIEEVPWTMYYWESFAIHGAYWHNDFGKPRSHGCTNLAPADAKWLFYWTDPFIHDGWQGREQQGTKIYITK